MFITKSHLSRRTFLRGVGATVALPFLDSMVGAQTPLRQSAAAPRTRFVAFYVPHGATMDKWTPAAEGTGFAFTEILKPLEPFRDRINIVSGLAHPYVAGAGGGDVSAGANHTRAAAVFLTGAVPERGAQAHLGVSADQVAAQQIGQDTPLPSLELSIEEAVLACEAAFSCAYRNSISWKSPTEPLPMDNNPRLVFEKLFGVGATDAERRARRAGVAQPARLGDGAGGVAAEGSAGRRSPAADAVPRRRARDRATDSTRRSVGAPGHHAAGRADRCAADVPGTSQAADGSAGHRAAGGHHARLDADVRPRTEQRRLPGTTIRDPFHNLSHHSNDRANMDRFAQLNAYHMTKFAYFVDELKETPDGDGTLLDHSLVLYGSSLSDGNQHNFSPLPIVLAGGASGQLKADAIWCSRRIRGCRTCCWRCWTRWARPSTNFGDGTGVVTI